MHAKFERLLSKSLTTLEVMAYYLVVHTGPGLFHLAATETPVMAAGWVNHQQAVGNDGRPARHHPILGNMRTEDLSTADRPQKKKKLSIAAKEVGFNAYMMDCHTDEVCFVVLRARGWA